MFVIHNSPKRITGNFLTDVMSQHFSSLSGMVSTFLCYF